MESWKKDLKEFADLYGMNIIHQILVDKGYNYILIRDKSIPGAGSQCSKIDRPKTAEFFTQKIEKIILHRNNDVTIKTNIAYLKYTKI